MTNREIRIALLACLVGGFIALAGFFTGHTKAQATNGGFGAAAPATCDIGTTFVRTTDMAFLVCGPTANTWSVGSSGMGLGTPTLSSCGTGATLTANSTNRSGTINVGTGVVLSCTVNFQPTQAGTPSCTVTPWSVGVTGGVTSISPSQLVIGLSLTLGGGKISYNCSQT